ncbi:hypothetical protein [Acinetobacter tianfuensis]|uniref:Lipoprotein n=1 Tax=Acinetobacter tianfuensis TaxID=2419603 RepID=A0A3A8ETN3_9GAMM|nr:hypothetical protein [Acinetobacter tianfuensis]RKG34080.1 hypothetical protein D7V32_02180 [Acinetobacter tianfuensis]
MNLKLVLAALLIAPLALTACAKKEAAPQDTAEASAPVADEKTTPEQQAAIDALDQPVLDEKNTDIPAEIANAPADAATPDSEASAALH